MSKRWCGILLGFSRLWEGLNDENFQDLWISPQVGVIFGTANYSNYSKLAQTFKFKANYSNCR